LYHPVMLAIYGPVLPHCLHPSDKSKSERGLKACDAFPFAAMFCSDIKIKGFNTLRLTESHFKSHSKVWDLYKIMMFWVLSPLF
jgi:hypothetical protein